MTLTETQTTTIQAPAATAAADMAALIAHAALKPLTTTSYTLAGREYPLTPYTAPDGSQWTFDLADGNGLPYARAGAQDLVGLDEMIHGEAYRYLRPTPCDTTGS